MRRDRLMRLAEVVTDPVDMGSWESCAVGQYVLRAAPEGLRLEGPLLVDDAGRAGIYAVMAHFEMTVYEVGELFMPWNSPDAATLRTRAEEALR